MEATRVAAQLYTVRQYTQTPSDLAAALRKIRKIGYPAVQISAIGPIGEGDLAKMLRDEGLICCSTHEDATRILSEPAALVERLRKLDCRYTAYPHPSGVKLETAADVKALAAKLNAAGEVFHKAGIGLAYHNHSIEFRRFNGRLMLEVLYDETDARYLQGELDTYWVQYGGGDPVRWCQRLRGRLPLLHMKDYAVTAESKPTFAEIGAGNLEWKSIVAAAQEAGCEWYIVEQDICAGDPFESLRASFDFIREKL
jgi:sugar phosphate isomerase/epimerase